MQMKTGALKVSEGFVRCPYSGTNRRVALTETLKADHGFNVESKAIRDLIELFTEYDVQTRRSFLQFITGSPKLPIGGT